MRFERPIILALDTSDVETARKWIETTCSAISTYKVGLEFFLAHGFRGVSALREAGDFDLFLDLKLHDIPNTVAGAVNSVKSINPKFLTVHASGGTEMISRAVSCAPEIAITAVTILTSIGDIALKSIGFAQSSLDSAVNLSKLAVMAGAQALVSSPLEVQAIRNAVGVDPIIITPGVRPIGSELSDQTRVMTPKQALLAGSDFLVIGRPITSLWRVTPAAMSEKANEIMDSIH